VRNTRVFDRFVPLTTQAGFTLAGTYNDPARADRERPAAWRVPTMAPYDRLRASGGNEAVLEQRFRAEAVAYARRHPPYVAKVIAFNTMRLLDLRGPGTERPAATESGISGRVSDVDVYAFYVLALLALLGAAAGGLRGMPVSVWLVPVAMAISLVPVIAYMRYRLPIDPFLIVIVAGAVAHQRLRGVAG
jgi:hypothetical protein